MELTHKERFEAIYEGLVVREATQFVSGDFVEAEDGRRFFLIGIRAYNQVVLDGDEITLYPDWDALYRGRLVTIGETFFKESIAKQASERMFKTALDSSTQ